MKIQNKQWLIVLMLITASNASAVINEGPPPDGDPQYWSLWSDTLAGSNGLVGNGAMLQNVCGDAGGCGAGDTKYLATFMAVEGSPPTGSGLINPFLRFQHNENAPGYSDTELAFNTDYKQGQSKGSIEYVDIGETIENQAKDVNAGGQQPRDTFNHTVMVSDLLAGAENGKVALFLDINEPGNENATLRLDELAIFVSQDTMLNELTGAGDTDTSNAGSIALTGATKLWDMDFAATNGLDTNIAGLILDNINPSENGKAGSGDYDMKLLLDVALFEGFEDQVMYLYNFAGEAELDLFDDAESGFEEWAYVGAGDGNGGDTPVPEPTSLLLMGAALPGMIALRRRKGKVES